LVDFYVSEEADDVDYDVLYVNYGTYDSHEGKGASYEYVMWRQFFVSGTAPRMPTMGSGNSNFVSNTSATRRRTRSAPAVSHATSALARQRSRNSLLRCPPRRASAAGPRIVCLSRSPKAADDAPELPHWMLRAPSCLGV
jgi:hypothetical protein